ncbi:arylsulfatase [Aquimarina algicola]|nr:arylsulfatase [Aquimarina algicola]
MKMYSTHLIALLSLILFSCGKEKKDNKVEVVAKNQKPNIIYILADDLGYGDLGCYGQEKIETPNLDRLASRGIKFTQHYSGAAVCAPARSSLLTGQHTGHTPIRGNRELNQEGQVPLPAASITIPELLKKEGYATAAFGKWGLGFNEGDPNNQGFDEFFGYNCQRLAHRYYPPYLNHNQEQVTLPGNDWTHKNTYAPDVIQQKTLGFIESNKDNPFFLYVPLVLPHAELISPNDSIYAKYKGKFEEIPYTSEDKYASDYGPDIIKKRYSPQDQPYATYATMVTRLDAYVGQIVEKVEDMGIAENTIIMFASDNGPHNAGGANPVFFNSAAGLRGIKRDLYEGGIRSPFIVIWPNHIKEGTVSNHVSAFWDVMPTLTDLVGAEEPTNSDGISMLPTLLGKGNQKEHDYLYWEFNVKGGRKAIRKGNWKAVWYNINKKQQGEIELYNLDEDMSESNDIAEKHPELVEEFRNLMKISSTSSKLFPFE